MCRPTKIADAAGGKGTRATALAAALAAALTAALTACGGGGSSSTDTGSGSASALALSASNYTVAAQQSLEAAMFLDDTGGSVTAADSRTHAQRQWLDQALAQLRLAPGRLARLPQRVTGANQTYSEPCSGGGTMTITGIDSNGNGKADAGDAVNLVAHACHEGGEVLDGAMSLTFSSLTGNLEGTVFSLAASVTLSQFAVTDASGSYSGDGSLTVAIAANGVDHLDTTIGAPDLTTVATYGSTHYTQHLSGFTVHEVVAPAGSGTQSTLTFTGRLASSAFDSRWIDVSTPVPFVRSSTQVYPASGQLAIVGAQGSRARVTAVDATSVLIELDADGNGTYETSTTRAWSDLV